MGEAGVGGSPLRDLFASINDAADAAAGVDEDGQIVHAPLTDREMRTLRAAFESLDAKSVGTLSKARLARCLSAVTRIREAASVPALVAQARSSVGVYEQARLAWWSVVEVAESLLASVLSAPASTGLAGLPRRPTSKARLPPKLPSTSLAPTFDYASRRASVVDVSGLPLDLSAIPAEAGTYDVNGATGALGVGGGTGSARVRERRTAVRCVRGLDACGCDVGAASAQRLRAVVVTRVLCD